MLAQILNGILTGSGYALAAVGISYTFGISKVMNFAYGTFYMLAAFSMFSLIKGGVPYYISAIVALLIVAIGGLLIGRVFVLPLVTRSEDAVLIVTLAISVALTNFAQWKFGSDVAALDTPFSKIQFHLLGAKHNGQEFLIVVVAPLVTVALVSFMKRTITGSRIRAVSERPDLSGATGINVKGTYLFAFVVGIVLAALTGIVYAPTQIMSVFMGDDMLLKAFTVAALAGMGQLWGAFAVGLGIGIAESLSITYVSSAFTPALLYGLLVVILVFAPKGIFRAN